MRRKKKTGRPPLPIPKAKPRPQMLRPDEITEAIFEKPNGAALIKSFEKLSLDDQVSVVQEMRLIVGQKIDENFKAIDERAGFLKKAKELLFHA